MTARPQLHEAEKGEPRDVWHGDVPTPALVLDRAVLDANIRDMAARATAVGARLWPHAKTHKSTQIARAQLAAGAQGITVATVAEAETMAAAGVQDILLAYPPVDRWRLQRIVALAASTRVVVSLDDLPTVISLDEACAEADVEIGYLWEVDCGNRRCGTLPGQPTADLVCRAVEKSRRARYRGLMTFPGHAYGARDDRELRQIARDEVNAVRSTEEELAQRGIVSPVLSIGSTPTARYLDGRAAGMQLRPGNYVFNDATQVALGVAPVEACALTVLTTVISRPSADRVIFDAGSKALSSDRMTSRTDGYGIVCGLPEVKIERLYEEHAIARTDHQLEVGTRVRVIPNHACTAANLHASAFVVEDGSLVDTWSIAARGWS